MRDDQESSQLPPGYRLDLIGDPCIIVLRAPDGRVVARFTHKVDPEEIRRAAQEDNERPPKHRAKTLRPYSPEYLEEEVFSDVRRD